MRVYVAGPMTGLPEYNFPAFHRAAADWRAAGWTVLNPAENFGGDQAKSYAEYMRKDIADLLTVDGVAFLPGWERSRGATLEHRIASTLGLDLYDAGTFRPLEPPAPETPLQEAQRLVHGDRQASYGHPIEDFTRTGRMWGAILGTDDVPPEKVALCMIAVKMSRECNRPKRDNAVDMAGYAETLHMVRERQGVAS